MISKLVILCGLSVVVVNSKPKNWMDMLNDINKKHFGINTIIERQRRLVDQSNSNIVKYKSELEELEKHKMLEYEKLKKVDAEIEAYNKLEEAYYDNERNSDVLESNHIPKAMKVVRKFIEKVDSESHIAHHPSRGIGSHGEFIVEFMGEALPEGTSGDGRWYHIAKKLYKGIMEIATRHGVDGTSLGQARMQILGNINAIEMEIKEVERALHIHKHGFSPVVNKENIGTNTAAIQLDSPSTMNPHMKTPKEERLNERPSKGTKGKYASVPASSSSSKAVPPPLPHTSSSAASSATAKGATQSSNYRSQSPMSSRTGYPPVPPLPMFSDIPIVSGTQSLQRPPLARTNSIRQTSASSVPRLIREVSDGPSGLPPVPPLPTLDSQISYSSSRPAILRTTSIRSQSPGLSRVGSGQQTPYVQSPPMTRANSREYAAYTHIQTPTWSRASSAQSTPVHKSIDAGYYGRSPLAKLYDD